jgi:putative ABC transport system permease protein
MWFLTLIIKNVLRRPIRSILTSVGVALAVGAVVALLGISAGFEKSFAQLYESRGVDLIVLRAGITERLTSSVDENVGRRLLHLPGVQAVTAGLIDVVSFPEANLIGVPIQGWAPDSFLFDDLKIIAGRRLHADDRRAVMLGTILAQNLGKKPGDTINIETENFRVVGVYESFNVFENGSAVLLLAELQRLMDRPGQVTGFQVILSDAPDKAQLRSQIRQQVEKLCDQRGRPLKLSALPTREYVQSTFQIRLAHAMAWLTSTVALLIGTIGMLNTMIMSVFEQTREIGILRAIGWPKRRIVRMILGESLVLCLSGALLGSTCAVALIRWLSTFKVVSGFIDGYVPPLVVVQGFVIALLVGLLGGVYPAYRGASLAPTEAIRHE